MDETKKTDKTRSNHNWFFGSVFVVIVVVVVEKWEQSSVKCCNGQHTYIQFIFIFIFFVSYEICQVKANYFKWLVFLYIIYIYKAASFTVLKTVHTHIVVPLATFFLLKIKIFNYIREKKVNKEKFIWTNLKWQRQWRRYKFVKKSPHQFNNNNY